METFAAPSRDRSGACDFYVAASGIGIGTSRNPETSLSTVQQVSFDSLEWTDVLTMMGQGLIIALFIGLATRPLWDANFLLAVIRRSFRRQNPQLLENFSSWDLFRQAYKQYGGFSSVYNFAADFRGRTPGELKTALEARLGYLDRASRNMITEADLEGLLLDDELKGLWSKLQARGWRVRFGDHFTCYSDSGVIQLPLRLGPEDPRLLFSRTVFSLRLHHIYSFHKAYIRDQLRRALQDLAGQIPMSPYALDKSIDFLIDRTARLQGLEYYRTLAHAEPEVRTAALETLLKAGDQAEDILHHQLTIEHILPIALAKRLRHISWVELVPPLNNV